MAAARAVSLVFQPAVTLTVLLDVLAIRHPAWRGAILAVWALLAALPALALAIGMRLGVWSDIEITRLRERRTFLPIAAAMAAAIAIWALLAPFPYALRLVAVAVAVWLIGSTLVSFVWKISLHEGATVGMLCLVAWLFGIGAAGAFVWAPLLVAWARLRLGQHTPAQLLAGAAAAGAAFALALRLA
jgi:hypothetical protein